MPETAIHVEMVGRVLLRFIAADVGGPVELGTAARLEGWFAGALRPAHLIAPLLLRKHITIHGQAFLEPVQLLSLDPTLHILHILPQPHLQLRHL